jgi:4-amino-4-deoxychorismate lyase
MIARTVWINGREAATVAVADRGLHYGDGLFETIAVVDGRARLLELHLERLAGGCTRLGLPAPAPAVETEIRAAAVGARAIVKVIITRGSGGRGYRPPSPCEPTRIVSQYGWPEGIEQRRVEGVRVRFCSTRLGRNRALAGIKHLNRLEQVLARAEWRDPDIDEGLMLDDLDRVVCGTQSNLFVVQGGEVRTPPLDECGVAGVMRRAVAGYLRGTGMRVVEQRLSVADVECADEAFLTSAVIGVWPVRELAGRAMPRGPVVRNLVDWVQGL